MKRFFSCVCALVLLAGGCSKVDDGPPTFTEKEKEIIAAARRAVNQFEDWADRAEFKISRRNNQWHVTALRVEYPKAKGNKRYVPWGRREMVIDDAGKVLSYANDK